MATTKITFPAKLNLASTLAGAKTPVMDGPYTAHWSTRTPDGVGSLTLKRTADDIVEAEAWGDGESWLMDQAPKLLGHDDNIDEFSPPPALRDEWLRSPFRMARTDRVWDALLSGILGQKVQTTKARESRRKISYAFGEKAPGPNGGWVLPAPATMAGLGYADLHQLGVERKRADILIRAAREMPRLENLTNKTPQQVATRLEAIRGIGPWTTGMVRATAMGDPDAVPIGDYHLPNTIAWLLAKEERADDQRMLELLAPYEGHRWRVIRMAKSRNAPRFGPRLSLTDFRDLEAR